MKSLNKLKVSYSKKEKDLMFDYPLGIRTKSDGHYLSDIFNEQFTNELKERGYDIESLKFEITVKPELRPDKFETLLKEKNEVIEK